MLVPGAQQSDSVIHTYISILFQILFPYRLLQNIEYSSLCYTVAPCWLSISVKFEKTKPLVTYCLLLANRGQYMATNMGKLNKMLHWGKKRFSVSEETSMFNFRKFSQNSVEKNQSP